MDLFIVFETALLQQFQQHNSEKNRYPKMSINVGVGGLKRILDMSELVKKRRAR